MSFDGAVWRKAQKSADNGGECVKVARATVGNAVGVRDSKDENGPVLVFTPSEWDAFVHGVKGGEFDL
ncbi:DUF397 domain-containing protein [Herbidospora galbida]|uniref:DUF397 domain-containing protein n=1 Tax=Herbidospora galbida TaxID=2575442 RepID=A0A4U3M6M9_9ACTN|nr:DUF397 domain-containing protein [Herbidospora galbida]TKK84588.1 DUF397 domain-containing protein [Herbidospora galbida]